MRRGILLTILFSLLANILFISGAYIIGNQSSSIQHIYGPSENIQGWINISLVNENINTKITDSLNNEISVLNLLRSDPSLIEDQDYYCNPSGCGFSFNLINLENVKTFTLNKNQDKILGFKFDGIIDDIENTKFKISSDAGADCSNQIKIDFFADGEIDTGNTKIGTGSCSTTNKYGCYDNSKPNSYNLMPGGNNKYCQRMRLSESPGFIVGAFLKIESGAEKTKMAIYDLDLNEKLGECELNDTPIEGEVSCEIPYLITKPDDYYICISNSNGIDSKTQIKSYVDSEKGCGFYTSGFPQTEGSAYSMFVIGKNFDFFGTQNITEDSPLQDLSAKILDYIFETYGSYECPLNGCIIPIVIESGKDQSITVKDISITYTTSNLGPKIISQIGEIELGSATINTNGNKKISLNSAGFKVPSQLGSIPYSTFISTDEIFIKDISIQAVPEIISVTPTTAFTLFPINFVVNVNELENATIDEYSWQFGNSAPIKTNDNRFEGKIFNQVGPVLLKVSATDINGKTGTKTFTIEVGDFQTLFLQELNKAKENIENVSQKINSLTEFYQEGIKAKIDIEEIKRQLNSIEESYQAASTENEYASVVNDFLSLNIPNSINERISTEYVSFYPNKDNVNVNVIKEFLGGNFEPKQESNYMVGATDWSVTNINSKIKYKRIDANFNGVFEPVLNVFELKVRQIGETDAPASVFIRQLEDMQFDKSYGETVKAGYIEIPIGNSENTITFLTTEDVDVVSVPIFFSPSLSDIPVINFEEEDVQSFKWALFIVIIIFLILVGLITYIILQHWYKTKYETYLFKNRNYLFNLIHYIDTQKKKGVKDSEIFSKLKKQGWNSEQINYVIKKYLGKRTGMLEIPVEKILGWFRKQPTPTLKGNLPPKPGMLPQTRPPIRRGPIGPGNRFKRK